jgi:hypothetical protein
MTKWDTIQEDVKDQYAHWDDVDFEQEENEDEDFFGFSKAISIDHLTDEEVEEVFNMFGDK